MYFLPYFKVNQHDATLLYSLPNHILSTNLHHLPPIKSPQAVKHTLDITVSISLIMSTYRWQAQCDLAALPPYYQCTLHKLREEMVKYSPVSIISLSLIRMPASDNPYKSLRAIPYLKYHVILLIPPSGCISAGWGMAWGLLRQQAINQPGLS